MSLVQIWKEDKGYREGLELLEIYLPKHSLLPTLRKGESPINQLYLEAAIDDIPDQPLKKKKKLYQKGNTNNPEYLFAKKNELFVEKIKRRKGFFTAKTNKERAEINQDLIQYRKEIFSLSQQIKFYQDTGKLTIIPDVVPKKMVLPEGQIQLMKLLYNTRSSISKTKKSLKEAYEDQLKRKIKKYGTKLKLLESKKIEIERQIQNTQ